MRPAPVVKPPLVVKRALVPKTVASTVVDQATGVGNAGPIGPPWPDRFTAADAIVGRVALYRAPGTPVPTGLALPNPTVEGLPLVFLVRREQAGWLQVQFQARPNGATAWIRRSDVALREVANHIVIERGTRRLSIYHGDQVVLQDVAAVGKASSPTPLGTFYVDGIVKVPNPNGAYGAYQVSFTGFSDVYHHFGSGIGQVAMHGTNQPALLGTPASHGCVRLSNDTVTRVALLAPTGTPVEVVA
ncbi:MAG: L,D-transpeptidase [Actinomycetota bacterium]|nr:L,D-transpeptidase [Actinomycetota bacterium]